MTALSSKEDRIMSDSDRITCGCTYRCAFGNRFITQVVATHGTIEDVLARRNCGETLEEYLSITRSPRYRPLCELLKRHGVTPMTLHHAVFIGWQALKSGEATPDEILGDCGLVHELVHALQGQSMEGQFAVGRDFDQIVEMARRIERAIPGSVLAKPGPD